METPILWQFRFSHFNEKARWALDYKAIPHVRRSVFPGVHAPMLLRLSGQTKIPVLQLGSTVVPDSTRILETLDERFPEPPLYPEDPVLRRRAVDLEEFFDEEVGWFCHAVFFHLVLSHPEPICAMFAMGFPDWTRRLTRLAYPAFRPLYARAFRIGPERAALGRRKVMAGLDRIAREMGPDGYLVGDRFSVADLTGAALMFALVIPPELNYEYPPMPEAWLEYQQSLAAHPAVEWIGEMYRRHRGKSAAINE